MRQYYYTTRKRIFQEVYRMFRKNYTTFRGESVISVTDVGECDLTDTFECGQAFRYERTVSEEGYVQYAATAYGRVINVGQRKRGELIFFDELNN